MKKVIYREKWDKSMQVPEGCIVANTDGYDGSIRYWGATTLRRYGEIKHEGSTKHHEGVFFAFSDDQFEEGKKEIGVTDNKQLCSIGAGGYGTKEGIHNMLAYYHNQNERIKAECDPQEVYLDECNNHEACINYDGDEEAIQIIIDIWGIDVARQIRRFYGYYDLDTPVYKKLLARIKKEAIERDKIDLYGEPKKEEELLYEEWKKNDYDTVYFENVKWCGWDIQLEEPREVYRIEEDGLTLKVMRTVEQHKKFPASRVRHYVVCEGNDNFGEETISNSISIIEKKEAV